MPFIFFRRSISSTKGPSSACCLRRLLSFFNVVFLDNSRFKIAKLPLGTRIAVMIVLKELLKKGQERNQQINNFIEKASTDSNKLLAEEASTL